jgi:hypothetical protein
VTDAAGHSDPVADVGRTFTLTGKTPSANKYVLVKSERSAERLAPRRTEPMPAKSSAD